MCTVVQLLLFLVIKLSIKVSDEESQQCLVKAINPAGHSVEVADHEAITGRGIRSWRTMSAADSPSKLLESIRSKPREAAPNPERLLWRRQSPLGKWSPTNPYQQSPGNRKLRLILFQCHSKPMSWPSKMWLCRL